MPTRKVASDRKGVALHNPVVAQHDDEPSSFTLTVALHNPVVAQHDGEDAVATP